VAARALRRWLAGWLAVALLAAWQASLLHPLEHVDEGGRFVHVGGADGSDARGENDGEDGDPADRLGEVLAALGAGAARALPLAVPPAGAAARAPASPERGPRRIEAPAYRAQAPPQSL
jgi:hypothetical protein